MAFLIGIDALQDHILLVDAQSLPAYVPVRRQALWQREIDVSVAETTLDSLFKTFDDIDPRRQPEHSDRGFPCLCNVKQVVEKRLPSVRRKEVELVYHKDD